MAVKAIRKPPQASAEEMRYTVSGLSSTPMFDNANQPPVSSEPVSGPTPGQPIQPFSAGFPNTPPTPISVSPERPPLSPPPVIPPSGGRAKGGRGKRLILIIVLAVVLLGGGAAAAALLFSGPATTGNQNANTNARLNANLATNTRTNANRAQNLNTNTAADVNTNQTNVNAALPGTNTTNTNTAPNANQSTNVSGNTNATVNTNTAANTNTATNTNTPPSSYKEDSDGDKLNNYLEDWLGTSLTNADSDSDGYPDGSEVTSQYSPLGDGAMTAQGVEAFCSRSTVILQYGLSSSDVTTLCGIAGDVLSDVQVMASNADFYEDLDVKLATSCTSFGKLDAGVCKGIVPFIIIDYLVSG